MTRILLAALPAALFLSSASAAETRDFEFDKSHTEISASWVHQGYSTQSLQFTDYDGTLSLDLETPSNSTVDVTFNLIGGLWAGGHHDRFINHLNTADFFETEINPTAHFVATSFESADGETGVMSGDLTMNGQTHPVSLAVTLNRSGDTNNGGTKLGFDATATILRSEWDMGYAVPYVSDAIEISISTELVAPAQ
jgi:polyisoprenoid-binding protein YceI